MHFKFQVRSFKYAKIRRVAEKYGYSQAFVDDVWFKRYELFPGAENFIAKPEDDFEPPVVVKDLDVDDISSLRLLVGHPEPVPFRKGGKIIPPIYRLF